MPTADTKALELVTLYQDCRSHNALPEDGGLFDQPEETMRWFRIIDERKSMRRKELEEEMETNSMLEKLRTANG